MITIASWNVNGVRASIRNGMLDWLRESRPQIFCIQETKATSGDLPDEHKTLDGYQSVWTSAKKKGYSGTATYFAKAHPPLSVKTMGMSAYDDEGRVQLLEYPEFVLINAYFPNSQEERARLAYKLDFCNDMLRLCNRLRKRGKNVIVCGDYNIAHSEIDLARPKDNQNSAGYYIEEREFMTKFLSSGYVDTFRHFTKDPGHYTWWSYRSGARPKNIGWRIDCHCVNEEFIPRVANAAILPDVMGSDHCPVALTIE